MAYVLDAPRRVLRRALPVPARPRQHLDSGGVDRSLTMDQPIIDLQSDHYFMGEALRQAAKAYEAEEVPIGAVIVREGHIIARAFNQVELLKDATAHAEMLALTQAEEAIGDWRLADCTIYVTKDPCPMCAGAIVHTRLARLVYGSSAPKGGAAGKALH